MGLLNKTPEERAARAAEKERQVFEASYAGRARAASERGDHVFQVVFAVSDKAMSDVTARLNEIATEGWELVSASFAWAQTGQNTNKTFVHVVGGHTALYVFRAKRT